MSNLFKKATISSSVALVVMLGFASVSNFTQYTPVNTQESYIELDQLLSEEDRYPDIDDFQVSYQNAIALTSDTRGQHVYTWGAGENGILGEEYSDWIRYARPIEMEVEEWNEDGTTIGDVYLGTQVAGVKTVKEDGTEDVWAWGLNDNGQIIGETISTDAIATPTKLDLSWVPTNNTIKDVMFGNFASAIVLDDGTHDHIYTWGSNKYGALGNGDLSITENMTPTEVTLPGLTDYVVDDMIFDQGYSGVKRKMAITSVHDDSGKSYLYTWGENINYGADVAFPLGFETTEKYIPTPTDITYGGLDGTIKNLGVSGRYTTATYDDGTDQFIYNWGNSNAGLFNDPSLPLEEDGTAIFVPPTVVLSTKDSDMDEIISVKTSINGQIILYSKDGERHIICGGENYDNIFQLEDGRDMLYNEYAEMQLPFSTNKVDKMYIVQDTMFVKIHEDGHEALYSWGYNEYGVTGTGILEGGKLVKEAPTQVLFEEQFWAAAPEIAKEPFPWWIVYLSITILVILVLLWMWFGLHMDNNEKHEHHWIHIGRHQE